MWEFFFFFNIKNTLSSWWCIVPDKSRISMNSQKNCSNITEQTSYIHKYIHTSNISPWIFTFHHSHKVTQGWNTSITTAQKSTQSGHYWQTNKYHFPQSHVSEWCIGAQLTPVSGGSMDSWLTQWIQHQQVGGSSPAFGCHLRRSPLSLFSQQWAQCLILYKHPHAYTCMTHTHTHTHTQMYACIHACMHAHIHTHKIKNRYHHFKEEWG